MQYGKPSLLLPERPLPGLKPVLVEVIFEAIERIREGDDTVLLMEQHALAALEIADTSAGVWQAQHAGRCTQAAR